VLAQVVLALEVEERKSQGQKVVVAVMVVNSKLQFLLLPQLGRASSRRM
jgi:hypothetical protein